MSTHRLTVSWHSVPERRESLLCSAIGSSSELMICGFSPPFHPPTAAAVVAANHRGFTGSVNSSRRKPSSLHISLNSSGRGGHLPSPDSCIHILVRGILTAASLLFLDPYAAIASPARYPCEDVGSYYSHTNGLEGAPLMKRLSSIVSPHRSLPYKKVWDALEILDAADVDNPESSSQVIEIYSLRAVPKALAGKPEGWNREHLWPRSYGLRDGPSLTDLHNIRPADVNVNSSRGNKYYGECVDTSIDCLSPANHEAALDTETDKHIWAPPLQVRGDIARSVLYMAVCYGFHQPDGGPNLQLSDLPSIGNKQMGLLSALLRWNELDPPSREEQLRNDRICRLYQHNRNPFIDHPDYANLIWKPARQDTPTMYTFLKARINDFHYNKRGECHNKMHLHRIWVIADGG